MKKINKTPLLLALAAALLLAPGLGATEAVADRLFGSDRYQTAVSVSQAGWPVARNAVLASGLDANLVDALTVAPLAKLLDAPILITAGGALTPATAAELKRLDVETVYVSSGAGVIREPVLAAVRALGVEVVPLGGSDRFATAANIAAEIAKRTDVSAVVVTTAYSNADALSMASVAALNGWPILLTGRDALPPSARDFIAGHNISNTYVIGGSGVVSDTLTESLPNSIRLGGADRYGTNSIIVTYFRTYWKYMKGIYVANGANNHLVDALTASSHIAGAPLILTDNRELSTEMRQFITNTLSSIYEIKKVTGLGGEAVASDAILREVVTALAGVAAPLPTGGGGGGGGGGRAPAPGPARLEKLEITDAGAATLWTSKAVATLTDADLTLKTYLHDAAQSTVPAFSLTSEPGGLVHHLTFSQPLSATYWLDVSPAATAPLDAQSALHERYIPDYAQVVASGAEVQEAIDAGKTVITVDAPLTLAESYSWRVASAPVTINMADAAEVAAGGALSVGADITLLAYADLTVTGAVSIKGELTVLETATVAGSLAVNGKLNAVGAVTVHPAGALELNGPAGRLELRGVLTTEPGSLLDIKAGAAATVASGGTLTVAAGTNGDLAGQMEVRSRGEWADLGLAPPANPYGWAWPATAPPATAPDAFIRLETGAVWRDGSQGLGPNLQLESGTLTARRDSLTLDGAAVAAADLTIPAHLSLRLEGVAVLSVAAERNLTAVGAIEPERNARLVLRSGAAVSNPALSNSTSDPVTYMYNAGGWARLSGAATLAVQAFGPAAAVHYTLSGPEPRDIDLIAIDGAPVTLSETCDIGAADLEIRGNGELIVPGGRELTTTGTATVLPAGVLTVNGSLTAPAALDLSGTAHLNGRVRVNTVAAFAGSALNVGGAGELTAEYINIESNVTGAVNGAVIVGAVISNSADVWPWENNAVGAVTVPAAAVAWHRGDQATGAGGYLRSSPGAVITFRRGQIVIGGTATLEKTMTLPGGVSLAVGPDSTLVLGDNQELRLEAGASLVGRSGANLKMGANTLVSGGLLLPAPAQGTPFAPHDLYYCNGTNWSGISSAIANHYSAALGYDGVSYTVTEVFITGEAVMESDLELLDRLLIKEKGHLTLRNNAVLTVGAGRLLEVAGALTIEAGAELDLAPVGAEVEIKGVLRAAGAIRGDNTIRLAAAGALYNENGSPPAFWADGAVAVELGAGAAYYEGNTLIAGGREAIVALNSGAQLRLTRDAFALQAGAAAVSAEKTFAWPAALAVAENAVLTVNGRLIRGDSTVVDGRIEIGGEGEMEISAGATLRSDNPDGGLIRVGGALANMNGGDGSGVWDTTGAGAVTLELLPGGSTLFGSRQLTGPPESDPAFILANNAVLRLTQAYYELRGAAEVAAGFSADSPLRLNNAELLLPADLASPVTLLDVTCLEDTTGRIRIGANTTLVVAGVIDTGVAITGQAGARLEFSGSGRWGSLTTDQDWDPAANDGGGGWVDG
ncbi:MAG: cell wall-binding repeat-containing protein [Gracilibacteraceae bacterium]|jgi:putative cell wall-binding protein|nr:cell wall-binding repeat-containing protein [Gracilibacteraceae bacterium]